jgi:hypothetical protein
VLPPAYEWEWECECECELTVACAFGANAAMIIIAKIENIFFMASSLLLIN